ncbi:DUF1405 domain-containing protein [Halovivax cerinus]|uniref:DUF1405 domain-containing protein n=1 Tax=Halovivax cerinus TaxID=1487865 RepID=A0ABD5NM84_9EURY|nr:DUF1405 domain-containing protein [Halovivax cerinus]
MAAATEQSRRTSLPRWLAPVPERVEDLGLRLAWPIVAVNLAGTAFGFWYYRYQFVETPAVMWPFVPDSPVATLLIALAIGAWKLGRERPWLTALAFFGNLTYGLWTPFTLLVFSDSFSYLHPLMYGFLFWSHLAMAVQALVLHRISDFSIGGIGIALGWYGTNLLVDYFVPIVGDPHHTALPVAPNEPVALGGDAHGIAAAGATVLTLLAVYTALSIHVYAARTPS